MLEGFDVGLEMSGTPAALTEMVENMTHGGRIALLGLPSQPVTLDLSTVVLNSLTLTGIYGREMFETWYAMSVMVAQGLDITPDDHPPVSRRRVREGIRGRVAAGGAARSCSTGRDRKGDEMRQIMHDDIRTALDEIRDAGPVQGGTGHHEPAGRPHPARRCRRGDQPLRQQLPGPRRPPGGGGRGARRRWTSGASGWPRSASSAARRPRTSGWSKALSAFLGTEDTILYGSCFDANGGLFEPLLGRVGRGDLRRAEPREHHRRHPPVQGGPAALPQPRHGRPRGSTQGRLGCPATG